MRAGSRELFKEAGKGFLQHARAQSTHALLRRTRQLNESNQIKVKSCVKSREPEIKSGENICFLLEILLGDLS